MPFRLPQARDFAKLRHLLRLIADGFRLVFDYERSHGSWVVDAVTGKPLEPREANLVPLRERGRDGWSVPTEVRLGKLTARQLSEGRWRLDIATPTGHRGSREFEVHAGQEAVRLRIALSAPGVIEGRLDVSAIPAAELPDEVLIRVRTVAPPVPVMHPRDARQPASIEQLRRSS